MDKHQLGQLLVVIVEARSATHVKDNVQSRMDKGTIYGNIISSEG